MANLIINSWFKTHYPAFLLLLLLCTSSPAKRRALRDSLFGWKKAYSLCLTFDTSTNYTFINGGWSPEDHSKPMQRWKKMKIKKRIHQLIHPIDHQDVLVSQTRWKFFRKSAALLSISNLFQLIGSKSRLQNLTTLLFQSLNFKKKSDLLFLLISKLMTIEHHLIKTISLIDVHANWAIKLN